MKEKEERKKGSVNMSKITYLVVAMTFLILAVILSFSFYQRVKGVYDPAGVFQIKEKNELSYQVHMKDNDYYDSPFLGMGQSYVYNYTDFVRVINSYSNNLSTDMEIFYNYQMEVNLLVRHAKSSAASANEIVYPKKYKKDYTSGSFIKSTVINNSYDIDLDEYKKEAERYARANPDLTLSAEIRVDFIVELKGKDNNFKGSTYMRSVTIPLSDPVYKIDISPKEEEKTTDYNAVNKSLFTIGFFASSLNIVLCFIIIFVAIKALLSSNSLYRETVNKLLRTYDDVIINTDSPMDFDKYEMLTINDFKELLDLSYNTNIPIMFYENKQGGLFYIFYNNMIYLHVISKSI